ncbi:MAG: pentapeptide repeat-containing protein, partial [Ruminococcus sp.]|nr:pentapeptide repeat-containing protein [Ruminococcus sp.]
FPNAVIVLDGYDELCLIENIGYTNLLDELQYLLGTHKVIVTTRPKYANVSNHKKTISIYLKHFDKEKRKQWLDKYKFVCNQTIEPMVEEYITNIDDEDSDGVCDTPMMLYMLCANGKSLADNLDNHWTIFNKVFYNVITETEYNSSITYKYFHNIYSYKDCIYRVNEEIAYRMYKSGNNKFVLSGQELKEIVQGITDDVTAQEITERSYALCSYWNINTTNGAVEFYHNNIRDFFLCEKIYRELNQLYNNLSDNLSDEEIKQIIDTVCELCAYGNIAEKVLEFIQLRAESDKKHNKSEFPENEHYKKCLPQFFEKMLLDGSIVWKYLKDEKNPIKKMTEIYVNIINIYVFAYQEYLETDEKINLYTNIYNIAFDIFSNDNMLSSIFRNCIYQKVFLTKTNLYKANLNSADLSGAKLTDAKLSGINLSGTNLSGTDLSETDLSEADLSGAKLYEAKLYEANLYGAKLYEANLYGAKLSEANLLLAKLSAANLTNADLTGANLTNADLSWANLYKANLSGAKLSEADLSGANLSGANLSEAKLSGANLTNANLTNADLTNADLTGANLPEAKLSGANLTNADLTNADLTGANLSEANLSRANLSGVNLKVSNLIGATLPNGFKSYYQEEQIAELERLRDKGEK